MRLGSDGCTTSSSGTVTASVTEGLVGLKHGPFGHPVRPDLIPRLAKTWETSPDRKTLYAVEMSTNGLYSFDLTAAGKTLPGKRLGDLLPPKAGKSRQTDCRAMCVGPDGTVEQRRVVPGDAVGAEFEAGVLDVPWSPSRFVN